MATSTPLVSVIVPCYNCGPYVAEAIESVLAQTYQNWELLVVDDGSRDNSRKEVEPFAMRDKRIRYHYQDNAGVATARNYGIAATNGKYIQLLDADDILAPDKIQLQVAMLESNPDLGLVYSDSYFFEHGTSGPNRQYRRLELDIAPMSGGADVLLLHMAPDNIFLPGAALYRRTMHLAIGGFMNDMHPIEDWNYFYRGLFYGFTFAHDTRREVALYSRGHGSNASGNRYKMWLGRISARRHLLSMLADTSAITISSSLRQAALRCHQQLINKEMGRYNLLYGNVLTGAFYALLYTGQGNRPWSVLYESAYLLKERALGRNKV